MIEALYCHKKPVFRFWTERADGQKKHALHTDPAQMVEEAVQWLGVYEDQFPGMKTPAARLVLYDWYTLWLYEKCNVMI
ncbi:hypothetical protein ACS5NO_13910 [Larkinella sp. GY13]|uniref:hypothetical protein n=1 Tax=Larkinella sp. GY13 TaxID=3453720 RepID=UPI003EE98704